MKNLFYFFLFFTLQIGWTQTTSSLVLINDTAFELTAIVQSATGQFLGQVTIQPGEKAQWSSDLGPTQLEVPSTPDASQSPFTVLWQCSQGGYYSVCANVSPAANVLADSCPGVHFCQPRKKEEKCPPCPTVPPKESKK